MWDKEANLKAYNNIEKMSNYNNIEELFRYREHLLEKSKEQSQFIKSYCGEKKKIKVFEACSGNSRLLYKLHTEGVLEEGTGIEISQSRVAFAEAWKRDFKNADISNICGNVLEYKSQNEYYDLVCCITGAFGYFYPIDENYPSILLNKFNNMLKKDGYLLLELYQHPNDIKLCRMDDSSKTNRWRELSQDDPFRFYLTQYTFCEEQNCLECKEIFIRRDGEIDDSKKEIIKIYSFTEIKEMLKEKGFSIEDMYSEWDKKEYVPSADKLIIMAKKTQTC